MKDKTDYRVANIEKKEIKLRQQRHEIIVSDSEKIVDMILASPAPATLIQSFPDQDLYYLMHKAGPYDFIPALAMASSEQWEYILDVEVWNNDRLDIEYMTKIFDILYEADPHRLLRWSVMEKPGFFEFYLFKNMAVKIREHDEPPPDDFDDYNTFDDKFYFRFPGKKEKGRYDQLKHKDNQVKHKDNQEAWELIEKMIKDVAAMDLSVFHGLLLESVSILPAEIEEEEFRLKNLRLAEKGFLPPHEAIGIYQPTRLDSLRERPDQSLLRQKKYDPDMPLPPQFFSQFLQEDNLFVRSLELLDSRSILTIESELAALINKVISADKIKLKAREDLEKAIKKTCDYLNLGLEIILKGKINPAPAKDALLKYFLEDIFRTGSRAGIKLKTRSVHWFKQSFTNKNNLPLSFLGENFLGVIGGLFLERPLYFDNYVSGELYRDFKSLTDINKTAIVLEKIIAADTIADTIVEKLNIDMTSFKSGLLTYKTLTLTLWAKNRLKLPPTLEPMDAEIFKDFFKALFQRTEPETDETVQLNDLIFWISETTGIPESDLTKESLEILADLINELEEEYATLDHENIDPKFIPHFLLTKEKDKTPYGE